jgi:LuxR family maltose regulon positive regulatory protein
MVVPLLQTKFYVPEHPVRVGGLRNVHRPHLLGKLEAGFAHKLTLLCAPAGFGQSTLLSEWIAHSDPGLGVDRPKFGWLSLDEGDNDPIRFWTYLIAALQLAQPELGMQAMMLLQSPQPLPSETLLTLLLNDLTNFPGPLCMVVDDYHLIMTPEIHRTLSFLLDHLPPQVRLCLATRADPPLPLARWRVRGQLLEIRADDLRFSGAETVEFLTEVMGLQLSTEHLTTLEARTEGWIAGLQLAALSIQGRTDVSAFIQAFSGSHRHVLSYLVEEVLNQCPAGTLEFLLQTAILDHMSAGLCDAVTGKQDSQQLLGKLSRP